ncbi:MAG TPA: hypothetical protein VFE19_08405 [Jatrophihabitantaceae bacterium]|nr:hypothetical protein [Jatrophihabitantaceae bacterium]
MTSVEALSKLWLASGDRLAKRCAGADGRGVRSGLQSKEAGRYALSLLRRAQDGALAEQRPSHLGAPKTAGEVVTILTDEQVQHGAEIALLRGLFPHTQRRDP